MARNFYVKSEKPFDVGEEIVLAKDEFNHIKNVLRHNVGDFLTIIDGTGYNYLCKIKSLNKNNAVLNVVKKELGNADPKINITVYQALVKGEKLELITQKLTELGISKLVPFYSEFCQVKPNTTRIDRLEKISIEALKQSGRSKTLEISRVLSFDEILREVEKYDIVVFAYEKGLQPLDLELLKNKNNIAIIIGSEGGFSEQESKRLESFKNIKTVSLGKRILRAETATIALSTLVLFSVGELD